MAAMPDAPRVRLSVLGVVVVALFGALFARLWYLQVAAAPTYQAESVTNRLREVQLKPTRGRILDVNGFVLVDNKRALVVTIERDAIKDDDERAMLFNRLSGALQVPVADLEERYLSGVDDPLLPFPISKDVSEATANYLMERREDFPGVEVSETSERVYRYGPTGANVIGYTARINDSNRDQYLELGYELSDRVGTAGIERYYEAELRGKPGKIVYEVDARERIVREVAYEAPVSGNDIQLTIDIQVQQLAEQSLEQALVERRQQAPDPVRSRITGEVEAQWGNYPAPSGAVVVEDPSNGSLLALASNPPFDPRWFTVGVSQEKYAQLFKPEDLNGPLVDRATTGGYAPASTFKPFTAYAALKNGYIESPAQSIDDEGEYTIDPRYCNAQIADCTFQNAGGIGTGRVDLQRALTLSSDVYFYRLGDEMMRGEGDLLQDGVREWGFGSRTGVQLPNEYGGLVPDRQSRESACADNPEVFSSCEPPFYYLGDNVQLAIGQGDMLATPLQMANAYSALANGGTLWRPNVVKSVLAPNTPDMPPPPEPVCDEPADAAATDDGGDGSETTDTASPPATEPPQTDDTSEDPAPDPCAEVPVTTTTLGPLPEIIAAGVTAPPTSASPTSSTLEPPPPPPPLRIPQVDLTKATIVRTIEPAPQATVTMPEEWRVPIIAGLRNVPINGTAATAFAGFDLGEFPIAGKTGTAQHFTKDNNRDSSLFTGFGPLQHEQQYTVTAVLVEAGFGAEAAAPVVRRMYEGLLGVTPLPAPYLYEPLDPRQDVAGVLPPYDNTRPITVEYAGAAD